MKATISRQKLLMLTGKVVELPQIGKLHNHWRCHLLHPITSPEHKAYLEEIGFNVNKPIEVHFDADVDAYMFCQRKDDVYAL